jgi:hypothetical protein
MSVFKNLPPHVARELRRHVSPKPLPKFVFGPLSAAATTTTPSSASTSSSSISTDAAQRRKMRNVVAACVAFTAAAASIPMAAYYWIGGLNDKDAPLTAPQVRRGAFQNSGTRDIGKDPNWDFSNGQYKKDSGYYAIYKNEGKSLPGEFLAMPAKDLKKHEDKIEAFAKGQGKNNG